VSPCGPSNWMMYYSSGVLYRVRPESSRMGGPGRRGRGHSTSALMVISLIEGRRAIAAPYRHRRVPGWWDRWLLESKAGVLGLIESDFHNQAELAQ